MFADIYFVVHGVTIPAHRVILAARSAYLAEMLHTKWQDKMVFFPRTTEASVLESYLQQERINFHLTGGVQMFLGGVC